MRYNLKAFLFFVLLTSSISCGKLNDLLTFTIHDESSFKVNAYIPVSLPFEFSIPAVTTNSTSEFESNDTKAEYVKDVKLKKLVLTITSPERKKFTFLKSIFIYINTDDSNEILLAWKENVSSETSSIELETTDENLDIYIKNSSYRLRTKTTVRETLTQDVDIKVDMDYEVTADVI